MNFDGLFSAWVASAALFLVIYGVFNWVLALQRLSPAAENFYRKVAAWLLVVDAVLFIVASCLLTPAFIRNSGCFEWRSVGKLVAAWVGCSVVVIVGTISLNDCSEDVLPKHEFFWRAGKWVALGFVWLAEVLSGLVIVFEAALWARQMQSFDPSSTSVDGYYSWAVLACTAWIVISVFPGEYRDWQKRAKEKRRESHHPSGGER